MEKFSEKIKQLYFPVQPTVSQTGDVTYQEIVPHNCLNSYIYCYWQLKTKQTLTKPFVYRVVADGCIDIFFELSRPEDSYVMGFCKKYTEFPLDHSFNYIGVRFLPTMFPQLFDINASQLSNQSQALENIIPLVARFISQQLNESQSLPKIKAIFDAYFQEMIEKKTPDFDPRLYRALGAILTNYGILNIETDLDTGISHRQLRRLFNFYVGTTPKTFSKVIRFQNILRAKPSSESLRRNKIFYDEGYYDQSHFIKEFKKYYGVSPSKAFGR